MPGSPTVQEFMTPQPLTVRSDMDLREAETLMRRSAIRHLPVVDGGALVGVLSERDVTVVRTLRTLDLSEVKVGLIMTERPLTVAPDARLSDAAALMVDRKAGSAVVVRGGDVVGIFTTVDALLALHRLLAPTA